MDEIHRESSIIADHLLSRTSYYGVMGNLLINPIHDWGPINESKLGPFRQFIWAIALKLGLMCLQNLNLTQIKSNKIGLCH